MSFSRLPAELGHQIIEEVASCPNYVTNHFSLLELRRVNRFFEQEITAYFAKWRTHDLKCRDANAMLPEFKRRLIRFRIGEFDGGDSALITYFHSVAAYIANLLRSENTDTAPKESPAAQAIEKQVSATDTEDVDQSDTRYWLNEICEALNDVRYDTPNCGLLWMDEAFAGSLLEEQVAGRQPPMPSPLSGAAFLLSVSRQHVHLQALLIQNGASPDSKCRFFGGHALRAACRLQSLDSIRRLLEFGACVQPQRQLNYSVGIPAYFAEVFRTDNAQMLDLLLEPHWRSPLIAKGRAKTAARQASMCEAWECLDVLIAKWPCIVKERDRTIFRDASRHGRDDVVLKFLQAGLDPSIKNYATEGWPLRDAVEGGYYSTCKLLIKHGADFDIKKREALFSRSAARGGSVEILQLLMRHGLETLSKDYTFAIAAAGGYHVFLEYVVSKGYHESHRNSKSIEAVALLAAIGQGHTSVIQYLVSKFDVSVNGIRKEGWPSIAIKPIDIAIDAGLSEVAQLLRSLGANPPDATTNFSPEARKVRENLLRQFKLKLELLERHTWRSYRGSQRLVDKALEVARQ